VEVAAGRPSVRVSARSEKWLAKRTPPALTRLQRRRAGRAALTRFSLAKRQAVIHRLSPTVASGRSFRCGLLLLDGSTARADGLISCADDASRGMAG